MSYRIASFNIRKFSKNAVAEINGKDSRTDVNTLAKIIRDGNFDIIAIQEILHPEALKALLEKVSSQYAENVSLRGGDKELSGVPAYGLNQASYGFRTRHWEGRWVKPKSAYGDLAGEGYAFIWNRDRVRLTTNYDGKVFEPRIAEHIHKLTYRKLPITGRKKIKMDYLVRPPLIGRFVPVNNRRMEIRLINTHITFGVPSKMKNEGQKKTYDPDIKDVELRVKELEVLLRMAYAEFAQQRYDPSGIDRNARNLSAYTFLMGDYNLNLEESDAKDAYIPSELAEYECDNLRIITVNSRLTTLKETKPESQKDALDRDSVPEHHLANNYDHFSYDENRFLNLRIENPETEVIYAFNYYQDTEKETKYDQYRQKISDHLPVVLTLDIKKKLKNRRSYERV